MEECCRCEKEIDTEKKDTYHYDYMHDIWCKGCMEAELQRVY